MKGKVLITFDDGIANQYIAIKKLDEYNIKGVVGVVVNKINQPGFCNIDQLKEMKDNGHAVINHSYSHGKYEKEGTHSYLKGLTKEEIIEDYKKAEKLLANFGFGSKYFMAPFGSMNLDDEIFKELAKECKWIRLTVGCNIEGEWCIGGNKRIFPGNYKDNVIGITVAADCRFPNEVRQKIDEACKVGGICVICYHDICSVVGEDQKITWDRYCADIDYINEKIQSGELEYILPDDII